MEAGDLFPGGVDHRSLDRFCFRFAALAALFSFRVFSGGFFPVFFLPSFSFDIIFLIYRIKRTGFEFPALLLLT